MKQNTLKELYLDELRDLYDAEQQLIKALPKMAAASSSGELRAGFEHHGEQTGGHAERLEQILEALGEPAEGKKSKGMAGLLGEGAEMIEAHCAEPVMDAGLISAARRVEHHEIAAYGTARTFAHLLGESEAASLLEKTLTEEKETDRKLTDLSERFNPQTLENGNGLEGGGEAKPHESARA